MTEWEELMKEDWAVIERFCLMDGRKGGGVGAWQRARCFRNKEVLLRTLLIHVGWGVPLEETAVRARKQTLLTFPMLLCSNV